MKYDIKFNFELDGDTVTIEAEKEFNGARYGVIAYENINAINLKDVTDKIIDSINKKIIENNWFNYYKGEI